MPAWGYGGYCIGNPEEITVLELAESIVARVRTDSKIVFVDRPVDDPEVRCPDIDRANASLGWKLEVALGDGLDRTIDWARRAWS